MKKLLAAFLILCSGTLWHTTAFAQGTALSGRVIRILGPNQVVVEGPGGAQYQVQMRGTESATTGYPAASAAEERLTTDLLGRHVMVDQITGSANQLQGVISYGDSDINRQWLSEGMLRYDENSAARGSAAGYRAAESEARYAERGVWRPTDETNASGRSSSPTVELEPPPGGWQFRPLRLPKTID